MFGLAKKQTPGLALLILIPAFLILSYFSLARSTSAPKRVTRAEPELNAGLDHDGLPDIAEVKTFNDRDNFRRWIRGVAVMQFYGLSDRWNVDQRDCAGLVRRYSKLFPRPVEGEDQRHFQSLQN